MQVDLEGNLLDFLQGLPFELKMKFRLLSDFTQKSALYRIW
jgi:hypothetical protein